MSVPSNKSQWQPTIPIDLSIYASTSDAVAPLGTRLEVGDRTFYFARLSTSANVAQGGIIVCATAPVASHQADILTPAATSAGALSFTLTLGASMATNEYAEGYLIVSSGTGNGTTYRIKSHGTFATAATDAVINLYDGLNDPMTATSELNFIPNLYQDVKVGSELLDLAVGVVPAAVTTGEYFWLQTWGPCGVHNDAAAAAGSILRMGTTGAVAINIDGTTAGSNVQNLVGKNFNLAGTDTEETPVFINIRP